jgi:hypothetical protein
LSSAVPCNTLPDSQRLARPLSAKTFAIAF